MSSTKAPPWIARLGVELLVVFIGVYSAFALSQYEARREADNRRRQLQEALTSKIRDLTSNTLRVARVLPAQLAELRSAIKHGQRPTLTPWLEPVRVRTYMWESTLQSGALGLLPIPTDYNSADGSQLRPKYQAYLDGLDRLAALAGEITAKGDSVIAQLGAH